MYHVCKKRAKNYVPYELARRLGSGFSEVSTRTGDVVMVGDWYLNCMSRNSDKVPEPE